MSGMLSNGQVVTTLLGTDLTVTINYLEFTLIMQW